MMYSSKPETQNHIENVKKLLFKIRYELEERGRCHDKSKLDPPELEYFDKYTPLLKSLKYGSPEYKDSLEKLKPALRHHYSQNRHHPEHWTLAAAGQGVDEVSCMNLIDIIEMFCDWIAASQRTKDGDLASSITISCKRFGINEQLKQIFNNTYNDLFK